MPRFLVYQRVRYVGPRLPTLEPGWEGFVSDANHALSVTTRHDELLVEFPNRAPRRQVVRVASLEAL